MCALFGSPTGLKNLAVQMSDPFGDDPLDFKLENFLASYYENALEFLADDYTSKGEDLPEGIQNPMGTDDEHRVSIKRMLSMAHAANRAGPLVAKRPGALRGRVCRGHVLRGA